MSIDESIKVLIDPTKSKFTRRNFDELRHASTSHSSPLAVIAHIDLDAFYAQCEQVRLGLTKDQPVVCRQWNSLIAVSYAARKYGISRMQTVDEALKLCPTLIFPHVATFKKGETTWKHYENPDVENHKVSLDPFRRESRKIFSIFKSYCNVIEKAGIDETFLDLGGLVRQKAMEMFPDQLSATIDMEPDENLPLPPNTMPIGLKWYGQVIRGSEEVARSENDEPSDALKDDVDDSNSEPKDKFDQKSGDATMDKESKIFINENKRPYECTSPESPPNDWEDILLMLGTAIVDEIRRDVFARLKYTCSAGISRNKILAKLASPRNKPNGQTVIPNSEIINFMCSCEFTDMWGLGGKFGDEVVKKLGIPEKNSIKYLLNIPLETLKKKTDSSTGEKIYDLTRGQVSSEVVTRINIKSMQSVKQFTAKPLRTFDDCRAWIKVFAADIAGRIIELDEEGANDGVPLRPKTVAIQQGSHYPLSVTRRKQSQFPKLFKAATFEEVSNQLIEAGESLLAQLQSENANSIFPCSSLSLSVSGIVPITDKGSRTIDTYFKKSNKPAKVSTSAVPATAAADENRKNIEGGTLWGHSKTVTLEPNQQSLTFKTDDDSDEESLFVSEKIKCDKCNQRIDMDDISEHVDWHFAKELQEEEEKRRKHPITYSQSPVSPTTSPTSHAQIQKRGLSSPKKNRPIKKPKVENNKSVLDFFQKTSKN